MERVAADIEGIHLSIADLDALLVGALVENAFDFQSRLGRGCRNQFDDGGAALQWPAAPVLRDVAEQAVLVRPRNAFQTATTLQCLRYRHFLPVWQPLHRGPCSAVKKCG